MGLEPGLPLEGRLRQTGTGPQPAPLPPIQWEYRDLVPVQVGVKAWWGVPAALMRISTSFSVTLHFVPTGAMPSSAFLTAPSPTA